MPDSSGDLAQIRLMGEQIADAALVRFASQHPEVRRGTVVSEIPAPLKWAAIIMSAVMTAAVTGFLFWMTTTVSEVSVTLARMDERMESYISAQESRVVEIERRVSELEDYHRSGGR